MLTKIFKPRSIISDHDGAFTSNIFQKYLDQLKIPLTLNALGDHHALGIIDNFAKRLKETLTKLFLSNGNTNWTNHINNIVEHYNRQPHGSLDGISPNDARKQKHDETITNLNIEKAKANATVSELQAGDYVRKNVLFNESFSKGTDNKWSNKVFRVESAHGNRIILNDKSIYKRVNLLKVSENAQSYRSNAIDDNKKENAKA